MAANRCGDALNVVGHLLDHGVDVDAVQGVPAILALLQGMQR